MVILFCFHHPIYRLIGVDYRQLLVSRFCHFTSYNLIWRQLCVCFSSSVILSLCNFFLFLFFFFYHRIGKMPVIFLGGAFSELLWNKKHILVTQLELNFTEHKVNHKSSTSISNGAGLERISWWCHRFKSLTHCLSFVDS